MSIVGLVILVLLMLLIWIFVKLAALPGQTAIQRGHPQPEAINVLGWVGLLLGVAPWLVALVRAYTKTDTMQQGLSRAPTTSS
ncbi:MAG: DUF3302 domain-containing protein [Sulfitobacter sp.]|nr:DUF3302 domain-containing protein [Sulfitobacter sp.]